MHYSRIELTVEQLCDLHNDGELKTNPDWQRDPVWAAQKKPALIHSLLNEIPIPEITLWLKDGKIYVVVDGQQRLLAILDYMNGDFKANESFFEDLTEEESKTLLETKITILLLSAENTEEEVIAYYKLRNSTSTALTAGELLRADKKTAILAQTLRSFDQRQERLNSVFGKKKEASRSADLTNRVPYLASLMHGSECLTRSYPKLQAILCTTTDADVKKVSEDYNKKLDTLIDTCKSILEDPVNARLRDKWKGFPPLGKISTIWVTILNPEKLCGKKVDEFWVEFYRKIHSSEALSMSWENYTRKNVSVKQFNQNIEWAHKIVGTKA
jgi:hypothetical protein